MKKHGVGHGIVAALVAVGMLAGCAGSREERRDTESRLTQAATAIEIADTADNRRFAGSELAIAREKLAAARDAAAAKDYESADRLIAEALINVRLAAARAETGRRRDQRSADTATPAARAR